ncbi:MAG: DUF116 domain-containing protein [Promethearchaeota archaeon]
MSTISQHLSLRLEFLYMAESLLEIEVLNRIKAEAKKNSCSEKEVIQAYIRKMNQDNHDEFQKTPIEERIVLVPQCLRESDCKAPLGEYGYICQHCNPECQVNQISKAADKLGYKGVYILPGGSMAQKIIDFSQPHAILGIACEKEALLGGLLLKKLGIIGRAILLFRDGCVNTLVKVADVLKILGVKLDRRQDAKDR